VAAGGIVSVDVEVRELDIAVSAVDGLIVSGRRGK
jgi:hypothetical protein